MKKIAVALGAVCVAFVITMGCIIGFATYKGKQMDASSKAYVDACLPVIVGSWSKDALLQRATPEARSKESGAQISLLFNKLKQLGSLQNYEGSKGHCVMAMTTPGAQGVTANYVAMARFLNGEAQIKVSLVQNGDSWSISGFHVNSPLFPK